MGIICDIFSHIFQIIDFSPLPESKRYFGRHSCERCCDFGFAEYEKRPDRTFIRVTKFEF